MRASGGDDSGIMTIRNPYGVGDSGEWVTDCKTHCDCCELVFSFKGHPRMPERWPKRCPQCLDHVLDGFDQERILALTQHAGRARERADLAYEMLRDAQKEVDRVDQRNRDLSSHLHDVTEERNKLRNQVNLLRDIHPYAVRAKCECGRVPCPEREVLYGYDPFVSKRPA
jgi:hypothetical protein